MNAFLFRWMVLTGALVCSIARGDDRPNVIVIFTDDHGYSDLSSQNIRDDVKTPYIDQLVAGGIRMTNGYVTAPQCVPSRAGLLVGKYQNRFGVESNGKPLDGFRAEATIAERLQKIGYATGMAGKWHLGPPAEIVDHGFDDVYFKNSNRSGWANFDLQGNDRTPGPEHSKLYHLDANTAAACAFIKRHRDQPFFFYCAYRAPHVPLDAPAKYLERFPGEMPERRRQALAMISAVDDGVGQIMQTLRKHKLEENTLILIMGDNGAPLKIHKIDAPGGGPGWDGSLNEPLNGEKGMLTEGGIRVPFVIYWKNRFKAGQNYHHPVISLDVAATACAVAGLSVDRTLDGIDLLPYLTGKITTAPERILYWRWISQSAIRDGKWKFLKGGDREYLFDLSTDSEEKKNCIGEFPRIAERMKSQLTEWSKQLDPPGIDDGKLADNWYRYYDHYLDGKLEVPPQKTTPKNPPKIKGWISRNGSLKVNRGLLEIRPSQKPGGQPFIVMNDLELPASVSIMVRAKMNPKARPLKSGRKTPAGDRVAVAFRCQGQKTFPPGQIVRSNNKILKSMQDFRVDLKGNSRIIHIRVLTPTVGADVEKIEARDTSGKLLREWSFKK